MNAASFHPPARPLLGLLGAPIRHSASPAMHEAAARALGLDARYHLIEVADADRDTLLAMLDGVRTLGFAGINVTFPYKEAVLPLLDGLDPAAAEIGAVNTVVVRGNRLIGHNTDATGFARALTEWIGPRIDWPVALIGAGGVGRAAAFALASLGAPELRIVDQRADKAAELAAALGGRIAVRSCASLEEALEGAGLAVNGTPVGMLPSRESPIPTSLLRPDLRIADAVYNPLWTPLLLAARDTGAPVMSGRELAIQQALDAFRLFTGLEPSRDAMVEAFNAVMAARETAATPA